MQLKRIKNENNIYRRNLKMKTPSPEKIDERLLNMCKIIVKKIEDNPENQILQKTLVHIRDCKRKRKSYRYYKEWELVLQLPFKNIKKIMLGENEGCTRLRHSLPFKNVITTEERCKLILQSYGRPITELAELQKKVKEFEKQEGLT